MSRPRLVDKDVQIKHPLTLADIEFDQSGLNRLHSRKITTNREIRRRIQAGGHQAGGENQNTTPTPDILFVGKCEGGEI